MNALRRADAAGVVTPARLAGDVRLDPLRARADENKAALLDALADATDGRMRKELIEALGRIARIRYAAPQRVPQNLLAAAAETGFYVAREPVLMEGRIELLHYCQNQSLCDTYHRYGNLGDRSIP